MTLPERTFVVMMTDKSSLTIHAARIRVAIASVSNDGHLLRPARERDRHGGKRNQCGAIVNLDEAYGYAPIARYGLTTEIAVYSTARHHCPRCPWTYNQARPLVTWWEHCAAAGTVA